MTNQAPDIFRNVHKGIRNTLQRACLALGRAGDQPQANQHARALLDEALRFVSHHGENEDLLLVPVLAQRVPELAAAMTAAHETLQTPLERLQSILRTADADSLYLAACAFTADYLRHMDDEETRFEPQIRAALRAEELIQFGQQSVQRTAPADARMMLGYMVPAIPEAEARALLSQLPAALARELSTLLE